MALEPAGNPEGVIHEDWLVDQVAVGYSAGTRNGSPTLSEELSIELTAEGVSMDTDDSSKRKPWGCMVAIVIASPVVYLLSIGPALWLWERLDAGGPAWAMIELLYGWVRWFKFPHWFADYINWCKKL